MIVTRCPLRISLVGGSSDLQSFLNKYDWGSVVSFPANIYTYITLKKRTDNYRIVYSKIENADHPSQIQNDIAREVLNYFKTPPVEVAFNSDIPSEGSGLASSSSYIIALIYAVSKMFGHNLSRFDTCRLAVELERKFNPLTGYQDSYGCGLGGYKRMSFNKEGNVTINYLPSNLLHSHTFYLIPTNKTRSSTKILQTINIDSVVKMRDLTNLIEKNPISEYTLREAINYSWKLKKLTSPEILTDDLKKMDEEFDKNSDISCHKLLGAGGGGYFLLMCPIPKPYIKKDGFEIKFDDEGVKETNVS